MLYINGIPYHMNNLGQKGVFEVGKSYFSHFSAFSYIFGIKMYGNRKVGGRGTKSQYFGLKIGKHVFYHISA